MRNAGGVAAREVSSPTQRISLRPARPRRRRKETDAHRFRKQRCERGVVKTTRERAEEKRQAKLDLVRQQLESGSLVIRQMTEEERRRYPPRPAQPKQFGRR